MPWAEPVLETSQSQSVAWLRHWCWTGSGCLQSTKAFPTPQWVPDLPGQTEGLAAGAGPAAGPHPSDTVPPCPSSASWGRGGSAGVNGHLEVKTPKKLQRKRKAFQGENSRPLWVLLNCLQYNGLAAMIHLLSYISSDAQDRLCQWTSLLEPGE